MATRKKTSKAKTGTKEQPQKKVVLLRAHTEKTSVYYANDTVVSHTKWDVQLNFGQFLMPPFGSVDQAPDQITIPQDLVIILSKTHARAFCDALVAHLKKVDAEDAEAEDQNKTPVH